MKPILLLPLAAGALFLAGCHDGQHHSYRGAAYYDDGPRYYDDGPRYHRTTVVRSGYYATSPRRPIVVQQRRNVVVQNTRVNKTNVVVVKKKAVVKKHRYDRDND